MQGVIATSIAQALRKAVGLRNVVPHGYARVGPTAIHSAATGGVADLEAFGKAVATWAALQAPLSQSLTCAFRGVPRDR